MVLVMLVMRVFIMMIMMCPRILTSLTLAHFCLHSVVKGSGTGDRGVGVDGCGGGGDVGDDCFENDGDGHKRWRVLVL